MSPVRNIARAGIVLACALGLMGSWAGPTQATVTGVIDSAGGYERCPAGFVCIFDGPNGTGKMAYFDQGSPDLRLQSLDDQVSSWWNRSGRPFYVFDGYNGDISIFLFGGPGPQPSGSNVPPAADNRASSIFPG
ncbi:MAG: peptidase inhibitor family I36 protein [Mycobacteriales bacterium]